MSEHQAAPTRRLFIAIMLPGEVQEKLAALSGLLDAHAAILRTVRPAALHFTLHFLGELDAAHEHEAAEACLAATADFATFPLAIGGFGAFPNARRPRVVWLGLRDGDEPLTRLQRRVDDELIRRRVVSGREPFTPHLTLARVRPEARPADRAALGEALSTLPARVEARCGADAVSLVQSHLGPLGSRYTILGAWPSPKALPEESARA